MRIKLYPKPIYTGTKALEGESYKITIWWNTFNSKWYMRMDGVSNGISISCALLVGKNLLRPFGYRNRLGDMYLVDNSGKMEDPNYEETGSRWTLEYFPRS